MNYSGRFVLITGLLVVLNVTGCGPTRPAMTPVEGKVLFNGEPLTFGCVIFQPDEGWPAVGHLRPDGTFKLTTYKEGDGAVIGRNRVRVTCFEGQRPDSPNGDERPLGKSLIPTRYGNIDESNIAFDVEPKMEPVVIELTD